MKVRKIKRKKHGLELLSFSCGMFFVATLCFFASTLFLRSFNNSLSTHKQEIETQTMTIQTQNDAIKVEIQTLSTRDRINTIASENGLSLDQNQIITITSTLNQE